jgi:ribonuclease HI
MLIQFIQTDKAFPSLTEAEGFVNNQNTSTPGKSTSNAKFYAVRRGRRPGIYLDWPSAQQQITGWTKPKHKSFSTRAEAEEFMREASSDELATSSVRIGGVRVGGTDASMEPAERSQPPAKKRKSTGAVALRPGEDENVAAGQGPMPAEDGFDPTIKLDAETGELRYKTSSEMQATKIMPRANPVPGEPVTIYTDGACRGNGQKGSIAGVGVFFGPQDPRYVNFSPSGAVFCHPADVPPLEI